MVTQEQVELAKELKIDMDKQPQKLISSNDPRDVVPYIESLLYSLMHMSAIIVDVSEIIQFRKETILRPYIEKLQDQRAQAPSGLLNKAIKALG